MKNFTSNRMQVCCCFHSWMKRRALPVTPSQRNGILRLPWIVSSEPVNCELVDRTQMGRPAIFCYRQRICVGFDPRHNGFFWLAGQGGYGVQTAPGLAKLSASLLLNAADRLPEQMAPYVGVFSPERLTE